jgi:hypothetical protein
MSMPEPLAVPEQKNYEYAYELAFKLAAEKIIGLSDLEEQCRRSGSHYQSSHGSRLITLSYLNREYLLILPEMKFSISGSDENIELRNKILILHYLLGAKGTPPGKQWITYQELKEGASYYPSFYNRAVRPLIDRFGPYPEKLVEAAGPLGGIKAELGDCSVTIPAFSRVPITLVLWKGDEEFPPNGNILFDTTILDYLPVEDINVLCQTIVWRMIGYLTQNNLS